jgi:hypothetical protein
MQEGLYVGEVIDHSMRATSTGSVYLSVMFRLPNGMGGEAKGWFTTDGAENTLKTLRRNGLATDPRSLDPRSGKDFQSFIGRKLLFQLKIGEYKGKPQMGWFLAGPKDKEATPEQIKAARALAGVETA